MVVAEVPPREGEARVAPETTVTGPARLRPQTTAATVAVGAVPPSSYTGEACIGAAVPCQPLWPTWALAVAPEAAFVEWTPLAALAAALASTVARARTLTARISR